MHSGYTKIGVLGVLGVKTYNFIFLNPKKHYPAQKHVFWRISRENRSSGAGCTRVYEPQKSKEKIPRRVYISRICRGKPPRPIFTKNGRFQLAPDVITPSKFDLEILTGYWFGGVQSLGPPMNLLHTSILQTVSRYRGSQWCIESTNGNSIYEESGVNPYS